MAQRQRPGNNVFSGYKVAPTALLFIDLDSERRGTGLELISLLDPQE
jgi:hypothetical protein